MNNFDFVGIFSKELFIRSCELTYSDDKDYIKSIINRSWAHLIDGYPVYLTEYFGMPQLMTANGFYIRPEWCIKRMHWWAI